MLSQLKNYLPEPETISIFNNEIEENPSKTVSIDEKTSQKGLNNIETGTPVILNENSATTDSEGNIVMTKIETQFDPDKA